MIVHVFVHVHTGVAVLNGLIYAVGGFDGATGNVTFEMCKKNHSSHRSLK